MAIASVDRIVANRSVAMDLLQSKGIKFQAKAHRLEDGYVLFVRAMWA